MESIGKRFWGIGFILIFNLFFSLLPTPAEARPISGKLHEIFNRSHFFAAETKDRLWVRYDLVLRDRDLAGLTEKQARSLLRHAFKQAPGQDRYESVWVELKAATGEEAIFGKAHRNPVGELKIDTSMFEANQAALKLGLKVRRRVLEDSEGFMDMILDLLKRKFRDLPLPERPERHRSDPGREFEL